jgi:TolA-binding protein
MPQQNTQEDLRLAEEMRYLDQVRGALRQSRPADALKWLTAYQRNCSAQRMLPEALLLRLRAEVSSGNRLAALATAQQIGSRFPKSPHAARAKELLALAHFE